MPRKTVNTGTASILADINETNFHAGEIVVVFDRSYKYLFINEVACAWLGRPEGELRGRRITDLYPEIIHTRNYINLQAALAGEYVVDTIESPGGRLFRTHYKPIRVHGQTAYVVVRARLLSQA
jgi:PAS domain-containing protein